MALEMQHALNVNRHIDNQRVDADRPQNRQPGAQQQGLTMGTEQLSQWLFRSALLPLTPGLLFGKQRRFLQGFTHPQANRGDRQADDERNTPSPVTYLFVTERQGDRGGDQCAQDIGDPHAGLQPGSVLAFLVCGGVLD
ncbi:hypothetical protein D3C71_1584870 [compost metagenome]